jgi:hypothetical protein
MSEDDSTTKIVSVLVELTFHGDYIDKDSVQGYAEGWIESGLTDRDDLRSWTITFGPVREIEGIAKQVEL